MNKGSAFPDWHCRLEAAKVAAEAATKTGEAGTRGGAEPAETATKAATAKTATAKTAEATATEAAAKATATEAAAKATATEAAAKATAEAAAETATKAAAKAAAKATAQALPPGGVNATCVISGYLKGKEKCSIPSGALCTHALVATHNALISASKTGLGVAGVGSEENPPKGNPKDAGRRKQTYELLHGHTHEKVIRVAKN